MGERAPQGLHPTMPTRPIASGEGFGAADGLVLGLIGVGFGVVMGWFWGGLDGEGLGEDVKKCKKNAKKCNIYCIYKKKAVSLQRIWE